MSTVWDVDQYERYKSYRDRPALDLMVQIPADLQPREVWDLGCGAGEHAALLARRHPDANVHGLDSSPDMLAAARTRNAEVDWVLGDAGAWRPDVPPDLIFSNAALQWLPEHKTLFPRIASYLAPGGVFACQVPVSSEEPWYLEVKAVAREALGEARMSAIAAVYPTHAAEDYWRWLAPLAETDIWFTRYLHVLTGDDPVVEWMRGTALRPYIQALETEAEKERFLDRCRERMGAAFPREPDGSTLFAFPRLFMIARRRPG